jgi:hypothetical protein
VSGWFSFLDGEATAGDVLALRRVRQILDELGVPHDVAWSPRFMPDGPDGPDGLSLDDAEPADYALLLFVCGPLHGPRLAELHRRFAHCRRVAVGTSVIDPTSPAVTGFHAVLARDGPGLPPAPDLALRAPPAARHPVVGVLLTAGQAEYDGRRLHETVAATIRAWLARTRCAPVVLETRLDREDGLLCGTADELLSAMARLDAVITDRLHGLVLALRLGVPAIAVDPVRGGAKVAAQADACDWPAVVPGELLDAGRLDRWFSWCLTQGRYVATRRQSLLAESPDTADELRSTLEGTGGLLRFLPGARGHPPFRG